MTVRYGLQGKNVLITGAAGGIGRALAAAFAEQGATLVLVDRHADALHAFARDLPAIAAVHAWSCDLTNDADVGTLAHQVWQKLGRIDVLINNAGVEYPTPISAEGQNLIVRWASLLDNNVVSMVRLTRALLPLMPAGASIINQSSIWGHTGVADFSAYSASKHAVLGLTRSLAFELAPRGIRVNAVCPGWIRTDAAMRSLQMMAQQNEVGTEEMERDIVARQAVPRMLEAADIAGVFLFLACADAGSITGQSIAASHGEVML